MKKVALKPTTAVYPTPAAVLSVGSMSNSNLVTLAWVGNLASEPPVVGISIRPSRHSFGFIEDSGKFVVNLPDADQVHVVDFCGTRSGKDVDKWAELGLTKVPGTETGVPLVGEFPVNVECKVVERVELGSHVLFLGEVLAVHVSEDRLTDGRVDPAKLKPLAYVPQGHAYHDLVEKPRGKFGDSQRKS
ncbi:MAG: flavin reductase family protein [Promethearchaeota archaeon]